MGPSLSSRARCGGLPVQHVSTIMKDLRISAGTLFPTPRMISPPSYLLLSVVGAVAANMMRSEEGMVSTIYVRAVRQMTTDKHGCGFTSSTVPATGPRGARALQCALLSNCSSLVIDAYMP
jgi:hypothetical protein